MQTTTLLRFATKSDRLTAAEFTTHTWRWHSDSVGSARCTFCGDWVYTTRVFAGGEWESWSSALAGAMLEHLEAAALVGAMPQRLEDHVGVTP